jgi:thioesterase domain-containing protein
VLKLDRVGRHDNFFELGGHSLLAVRVIRLLEQADICLSLANIFTTPTIAALAQDCTNPALRRGSESAVLIKNGPDGPALFLAHDGTGDLLYAQMLSQALNLPQKIYGLPSDGNELLRNVSVPLLAQRLVRLVRISQPTGPYYIAGWSFGGMLAYEIAAHLHIMGENVNFIGLIDSVYGPAINQSNTNALNSNDERALLLSYVTQQQSDVTSHASRSALKSLSAQITFQSLVEYCKHHALLPTRFLFRDSTQICHLLKRDQLYFRASAAYRATPLPMPVHLFQAQQLSATYPFLGWNTMSGEQQIRLFPVPGSHHSMLRPPNLSILARSLASAIGK